MQGDFNDFSELDLDVQGNMPTSKALRILQDIDGDGSYDLHNALSRLPAAERYSDWWDHATATCTEVTGTSAQSDCTDALTGDNAACQSVLDSNPGETRWNDLAACAGPGCITAGCTFVQGFSTANNIDDSTAEHPAEHSELDHLLLSAGLRDRVTRVWIDHGHNPADVSGATFY